MYVCVWCMCMVVCVCVGVCDVCMCVCVCVWAIILKEALFKPQGPCGNEEEEKVEEDTHTSVVTN